MELRTASWCPVHVGLYTKILTQPRTLERRRYLANRISPDQWCHSQSPYEFANSSRFTGSPVRGSQFASGTSAV